MRTYDHALYLSDLNEEFAFKIKRGILRWGFVDIPEGLMPPEFPKVHGWQARHFKLIPANPLDLKACSKIVYVGSLEASEWTTDIGDQIYIDNKKYIVWEKCPEYIPRGKTLNHRN